MEKAILKQLIVYSGMSQKMISIRSGVSETQISRYLHKSTPSLSTLKKIAKACGCEIVLSLKKN